MQQLPRFGSNLQRTENQAIATMDMIIHKRSRNTPVSVFLSILMVACVQLTAGHVCNPLPSHKNDQLLFFFLSKARGRPQRVYSAWTESRTYDHRSRNDKELYVGCFMWGGRASPLLQVVHIISLPRGFVYITNLPRGLVYITNLPK